MQPWAAACRTRFPGAYCGMAGNIQAVNSLIHAAETAAADHLDPLLVVNLLLKLTIDSEADPYLLIGELIEAISVAVARRIPAEKQGDVAVEAVRLLRDRLRAHRLI